MDHQGYLTTHVLDTALGRPAMGMQIELYRLGGAQRIHLKTVVTDGDGRTDGPMLKDEAFAVGEYELVFNAGDYLDRSEVPVEEPRFLSTIPIRFGISDLDAHYHVPLLISPFGYSTYRGS